MSDVDLKPVEEIVERTGREPRAVIPILQALQRHYGYLPAEALRRVCRITDITPASIAGASPFLNGRHAYPPALWRASPLQALTREEAVCRY